MAYQVIVNGQSGSVIALFKDYEFRSRSHSPRVNDSMIHIALVVLVIFGFSDCSQAVIAPYPCWVFLIEWTIFFHAEVTTAIASATLAN